jgi:hypothetical protein
MLRVITIVFISFALSACRTDNNVIDTAPTSKQSAVSSTAQQSTSSGSTAMLPASIPSDGGERAKQQPAASDDTVTSSGAYTAQPVSPPSPADELLYEPVSVTLEWTIPMQRENGDLLGASDLDGYIIEYSSKSGSVEQDYVQGGQVNSHSITLPPGSYQFRVIAVDNNGLTSNPSDWVNADLA